MLFNCHFIFWLFYDHEAKPFVREGGDEIEIIFMGIEFNCLSGVEFGWSSVIFLK